MAPLAEAMVTAGVGPLVIAGSAAAGIAFIVRLTLLQFVRDERMLRRARAC
ncbi:hypothetical protein [Nitrososphaera sp.]|uniref:hypothetical protein n=1 Tax=Nitrososphaera sp. TaxID=1971748 RepID=UPI00307E3A9B